MDKSVLRKISYGIYIVSTQKDGRDVGCVINTSFQVTSDPVTVAISLNKDNYTNPCILENGKFTLAILSESTPKTLIGTFGYQTGKEKDKFDGIEKLTSPSGLPIPLPGVTGYLECKVIDKIDCFTHTLIVGEVIDGEKFNDDPVMTYDYYHKVFKLKAPKNAPTYVAEK